MRFFTQIGLYRYVFLFCLFLIGKAWLISQIWENIFQHRTYYRSRNRGRLCIADYRLIQCNQNCDLWIVCRSKSKEGQYVSVLNTIFIEVIQFFRCTSFTTDAITWNRCISSSCVRTTCYNLLTHVTDLFRCFFWDNLTFYGRFCGFYDIVVRIDDLSYNIWLHQVSAVECSGQTGNQLDRCYLKGLTKCAGAKLRNSHVICGIMDTSCFTREVNSSQVT